MSQATVYTFDDDTVSDLHKDARGYRPTEQFWRNWAAFTDDQKQAEWDYLLSQLEVTIKEDEAREKAFIAKFEAAVANAISTGAQDRATAIKWLMDAEEWADGDINHFEWINGIPFGYIARTAG